jgi:transposase, IS5 family
MGQKGFWDWENRHAKLSDKKSLLDRIDEWIPWEEFRPILEEIHSQHRLSNAGRKPSDPIVMFKLILLIIFRSCHCVLSSAKSKYPLWIKFSF